ncbi:ParB/RepB/Spo0J family partition protein [Methylotenera mobilis]|uniref:ParB/RepB/Spo0J family partition protein n=1 Tax=Methylotenera mobilis TaxID=359408 RepID=UPI00037E9FE2|nr:ParB/RepB/Spo0J family partition protein [Methylotenera mobilis]PPC96852.1 MAG: chromosome partitioning protein ParB [Methylotenera sp.]
MVKLKGLGRGLDALLAGDMGSVGEADSLMMLKVDQLRPGKYQPRSYMDEAALKTLADSIKAQGIMQPILVRQLADEQYEIIAGERRWRASQRAGLAEVPVLVREIADESALAMALIENIQRENLNPLEEAQGIKRLIDEFSMTHEKAAESVGRSRVAVSNLLRLLTLSGAVQDMLMHGKLDMGHARALVGLEGAQQVMLAEQIVHNRLSVREAEALVKKLGEQTDMPASKSTQAPKEDQDVLRLQERLSGTLGASVSIKANSNGAGVLKINYANLDQLDEIIGRITR